MECFTRSVISLTATNKDKSYNGSQWWWFPDNIQILSGKKSSTAVNK